jgi:hypothetical protein
VQPEMFDAFCEALRGIGVLRGVMATLERKKD